MAPPRVDSVPQYGSTLTAGEKGASEPPAPTRDTLLDINGNGLVEAYDLSSMVNFSSLLFQAGFDSTQRRFYSLSQQQPELYDAISSLYGGIDTEALAGEPMDFFVNAEYSYSTFVTSAILIGPVASGVVDPLPFWGVDEEGNNTFAFNEFTQDLYGTETNLRQYVADAFGGSVSGNNVNIPGGVTLDFTGLMVAASLLQYQESGVEPPQEFFDALQLDLGSLGSGAEFLAEQFDFDLSALEFQNLSFSNVPTPAEIEYMSSLTGVEAIEAIQSYYQELYDLYGYDFYLEAIEDFEYVINNFDAIAGVFNLTADELWSSLVDMSSSGLFPQVYNPQNYLDYNVGGVPDFLAEWFSMVDGYNMTGEYVSASDLGIFEDPDLFFENYYNLNTIMAGAPQVVEGLPPNWPDYDGDGQFTIPIQAIGANAPGGGVQDNLWFMNEGLFEGLTIDWTGNSDVRSEYPSLPDFPSNSAQWDLYLENELYQQYAQESDWFNLAYELGYLCCTDTDADYEAWNFGSNVGNSSGSTESYSGSYGGLGLFDPGFLFGFEPGEYFNQTEVGFANTRFDTTAGGYTGADFDYIYLLLYMTINDLWGDPEWNPISWEYWAQEDTSVDFVISSGIDEDSIEFLNSLSQEQQDYFGWTDSEFNFETVPYEQVEPAFTEFLESGVNFDTNGDGVVTQLDIDAIFALLTEGQAEPFIINGVEFTAQQLMAAIAQFAANNETEFSLTDSTVVTWVEWGAFLDGGLAFLSDYYPDATLGEMLTTWNGFYNEGLAALQSINPEATTSEMLATWVSYVDGGQSYLTTANPDATTAELLDIWLSYVEQGEGYLSQSNPDATTEELLGMWIDYLSYTPTAPELPFDISDPSTWDPNFVYQGDFNQTTDPPASTFGFNPNSTATYSVYVDENGVPGALPLTEVDEQWLAYWSDFIAENGFDFNFDGVINSSDWLASLEDPNSGEPLFDWNGDGVYNAFDTVIVDTSVGWSGTPVSGDFNPEYDSAIGLSFGDFGEILSGNFGQYGEGYYDFLLNSFWGYGAVSFGGTAQLSDPVFSGVTPFGYWNNEGEWVWFIDPETNPFVAPLGLEGEYDYSLFNAIAAYVMAGNQLDPSLLGIDISELDPELLALIGTDVASYDPAAGYFTADQLASFDFDGDGAITEFDYNVMDYILYQAGQGVTSFDDYFGNQFDIFSQQDAGSPPPPEPEEEINAAGGAYVPKRVGVRKRVRARS